MPDHKRLAEAIEGYEQWRETKGKARTTVQNEMYVLRRFALWYGNVQTQGMTPERSRVGSMERTAYGTSTGPVTAANASRLQPAPTTTTGPD